MTTACPCFGRNENCRLCSGSGLLTAEVEAKVALSQKSKVYSGQSTAQKSLDAAAKEATLRAELAAKPAGKPTLEHANLASAETPAEKLARELRRGQNQAERAALEGKHMSEQAAKFEARYIREKAERQIRSLKRH